MVHLAVTLPEPLKIFYHYLLMHFPKVRKENSVSFLFSKFHKLLRALKARVVWIESG